MIDLLQSRSGIYHPAAYETVKMKKKRPERGSHKPGEIFWYNNWDFNALCTIFEQQTRTKVFVEFQKTIRCSAQDGRLPIVGYLLPFGAATFASSGLSISFCRPEIWPDSVCCFSVVEGGKASKSSPSSGFEKAPRPISNKEIQQPIRTTHTATCGGGSSTVPLMFQSVTCPHRARMHVSLLGVAGLARDKNLHMYSARGYGGHAIDIVPARQSCIRAPRGDLLGPEPAVRDEEESSEGFGAIQAPRSGPAGAGGCAEPPIRNLFLCLPYRNVPISSGLIRASFPDTQLSTTSGTSN